MLLISREYVNKEADSRASLMSLCHDRNGQEREEKRGDGWMGGGMMDGWMGGSDRCIGGGN